MNLYEVLVKLLPFVSLKDGKLSYGLPTEMGDIIITIFVTILIVLFTFTIFLLCVTRCFEKYRINRLRKVWSKFSEKNDQSEETYQVFEEQFSNKFKRKKKLIQLWNKYKMTLLRVDVPESVGIKKLVYSTTNAAPYFNKHLLASSLSSGYYATFPSILLSIGLIGTFFGLFYGLLQLDLNDSETLKGSMSALIQAAGAKFASSLWGLGLSILFTIYEKLSSTTLNRRITELQQTIDLTFPQYSFERGLYELNVKAQEQSSISEKQVAKLEVLEQNSDMQMGILNGLSMSLAEAIGPKISEGVFDALKQPLAELEGLQRQLVANIGGTEDSTLYQQLKGMTQGVGNDFSAGLQTVLNELMDNIKQSLGSDTKNLQNIMSELAATLGGLQTSFVEQQTELQKTLANQQVQLQERFQGILNDLQEGVGNIGVTINNQNQVLNTSLNGLTEQITQQQQSIMQVSERIGAGAEAATGRLLDGTHHAIQTMQSATTQQTTAIQELLSSVLNSLNEQEAKLQIAINGVTNLINQTGKMLSSKTEQSMLEMQNAAQGVGAIIQNVLGKLNALDPYVESFEVICRDLKDSAQETKETQGIFEKATQQAAVAHTAISTASTMVAQALTNNSQSLSMLPDKLQEVVNSLQGVVNQARECNRQIEGSYQMLLASNAESMNRFENSVQNYHATTTANVKAYQEKATEHINETFGEFNKGLVIFINSLSGAVNELESAISGLANHKIRN